ncbi:UbiX family flavin prenyltransferase [Paenibacillus eucommiae]|uniref:Flavin prenyltransferase UbiX n=1 Tax=Paenibacillus eucommiae TaxID=1355755 RepID=A0ABS4IP33_9BACL|nr:UbiX family flavin prenyltransferase [Paenibacillus eucommiae]MBP1988801.1 4-hydroxy-3-polyprenylbenzoate decarboxylase [Paenibacillus eucommiae]
MKLIVGLSGATGAIYGIRLLEVLKELGVETHLIISSWAQKTIAIETKYTLDEVKKLAAFVHQEGNQAAIVSSGSFKTDGMVILPCSMKTLAAVSHGFADNLLARSADVILKERRKLVIVPREAPLSEIHLENMLRLARMGVVILPPMPAFYNKPETIDDIVLHTVSRILDQFGIDNSVSKRWLH